MTERELSRAAVRRLAIIRHAEEVTGQCRDDVPLLRDIAMTCRYFGISRTLYYKWLRRYEELGVEGLRPRSRRPHTSPNATSGEVIGKIVHLRKSYHFGPAKISMYLKRYHDLEVSTSGVWRILKRLEMNRLPASQRYRRHVDRWKRYTVTVADTGGLSASSSKKVTVLADVPPTARLTVNPSQGVVGTQFLADASASTDPDNTPIATYRFNCGNGTIVGPQAGATATCTYASVGLYTITVTVTDTKNTSSTASTKVNVK
jgi:transposase